MKAALRANTLSQRKIAVEDHLAARRTLLPEVFGCFGARACTHHTLDPRANEIGNPVHGSTYHRTKRRRMHRFGQSGAEIKHIGDQSRASQPECDSLLDP